MAAKLSPPFLYLPTPVANPSRLNNVDKTAVVLPPGVRPPMRAERSGVGVPNLCEAMGELEPLEQQKIKAE